MTAGSPFRGSLFAEVFLRESISGFPVTRGEEHAEFGIEAFEQRRVNRAVANLGRRARRLG